MIDNLSDYQLTYLAGVVDSCATISITKSGDRYQLTTIISSSNYNFLNSLKSSIGFGAVSESSGEYGTTFLYRLSAKQSMRLFEKLYSRLTFKKRHIDIAIEFQSTMGSRWNPPSGNDFSIRERCYEKLLDLG